MTIGYLWLYPSLMLSHRNVNAKLAIFAQISKLFFAAGIISVLMGSSLSPKKPCLFELKLILIEPLINYVVLEIENENEKDHFSIGFV
jgi:hypothetical protein